MTRSEVISLLLQIDENPEGRDAKIREFQLYVWDQNETPHGFNDDDWDVMIDLAYDLDFYEPNPDWRREDSSFYGEDRLLREVRESLAKLRER